MSDKVPSIYSIKIVMKPREVSTGTLTILASGADSNYTTHTDLTAVAGSGEPNCNNCPITGNYSSGPAPHDTFSGDATFDSDLSPNTNGYTANVTFLQNGQPSVTYHNQSVSVVSPPAV